MNRQQPHREEVLQALQLAAQKARSDPTGALQDVYQLLIQLGHKQQAAELLERTRTAFQGAGPSGEADSLIAMLSSLAIGTEAIDGQRPSHATGGVGQTRGAGGEGSGIASAPQSPILQESGRESIADAAMADGSSYQCPSCGDIVSTARRKEHAQLWCQAVASPQ